MAVSITHAGRMTFYYVDTAAELPAAGLKIGDMAYAVDVNRSYFANSTTTWLTTPWSPTLDVIDFGAAPGKTEASLVVTGQTLIVSSSIVDAFGALVATADHSIDEHRIENLRFRIDSIVAGVGFTVRAECTLGITWGRWNLYWVWR